MGSRWHMLPMRLVPHDKNRCARRMAWVSVTLRKNEADAPGLYGMGQRDAHNKEADAPGWYGLGQRDAHKKTSYFEGSNPSRALTMDGEDSDAPEAKLTLQREQTENEI